MKVAFEVCQPFDQPYPKVQSEHVLGMTLRPGFIEVGSQRSAMKHVTLDGDTELGAAVNLVRGEVR